MRLLSGLTWLRSVSDEATWYLWFWIFNFCYQTHSKFSQFVTYFVHPGYEVVWFCLCLNPILFLQGILKGLLPQLHGPCCNASVGVSRFILSSMNLNAFPESSLIEWTFLCNHCTWFRVWELHTAGCSTQIFEHGKNRLHNVGAFLFGHYYDNLHNFPLYISDLRLHKNRSKVIVASRIVKVYTLYFTASFSG